MKIAFAQFNSTLGAFEANASRMVHFAERAKAAGTALVVFPELAIGGYPPQDFLDQDEFVHANLLALDRLMKEIRGIGVLCGCVTRREAPSGKRLHNSAVLFRDGRVMGRIHKRLLPTYDVFDERRYFEPGREAHVVDFDGVSLGIAICEDIWNDKDLAPKERYEIDPVADLVALGAGLILAISASPYDCQKMSYRRKMLTHLARKYELPFGYVNMVGGQDCLVFDGGSFGVDAEGKVVVQARDFEEDLVLWDMSGGAGDRHPTADSEEDSVLRAITLGLRDYMAKSGFQRAVVGLSGGIDSAVTAAVAARALGSENVTALFMPSAYTSEDSREDAQALSDRLGIALHTVPISPIFDTYLQSLEPVFAGHPRDVTEENIQARIRGNLLMAVANKFGGLVLATGNKSELAVGYCTLYGDLIGGYAVLSDISKAFVYRLARHLNAQGPLIPERVLTKAPTAELRPNQKDQDDLPPYDVIDEIIDMYVVRSLSPSQIVEAGLDAAVVRRVVGMIDRNEYKRRQAPIGPKITPRAFGCGRRYPVVHGIRHFL